MDPSSIFEYLQDHVKRKLLNFLVLMPFWVIPFLLFKPSIFEIPVYVQISLIFCLSSTWFILNALVTTGINSLFTNDSDSNKSERYITEAITFTSIITLSLHMLIGYYYSLSITGFLLLSYGFNICFFLILILLTIVTGRFR